MSVMAPLPDGYRYECLKRSGIPPLIEAIQDWHPDIAIGGGSCYLHEDFYMDKVFLDGEAEKDIFVGLFKRVQPFHPSLLDQHRYSRARCRCDGAILVASGGQFLRMTSWVIGWTFMLQHFADGSPADLFRLGNATARFAE